MEVIMQFGVHIPNFGDFHDLRAIAELAHEAEVAGWDGFFLWDHILYARTKRAVIDPWIALAAIAMRTERIRFGPLVTALPRRRPWKVARETVSLDHLSGGRLILGVGLGFPPDNEFARFGEDPDPKVRAGKLDEGLDILVGLWSGKPFRYDGEHYQVERTVFWPPPVQEPRIPIWVAGTWPKSMAPFRRAARWDGVCPEGAGKMTLRDQRTMLEYIQQHRTAGGPFDVVRAASLPTGDMGEVRATIAAWEEAGVTWWIVGTSGRPGAYTDMRERILRGPPRV
jgi:alkanesulfonate monooxygenase SsuD/methylene tetrahydromethanopterin reductase-like flavin-dependent oxidoreductase (luciferase family)